MFGLVWGQCSEGLQASIRLSSEYSSKSNACDGVWLITEARTRMVGISDTKNAAYLLRNKYMKVLLTRQGETESLTNYFARFKANIETLELFAGTASFGFEKLMKKKWGELISESTNEQTKRINESKDVALH